MKTNFEFSGSCDEELGKCMKEISRLRVLLEHSVKEADGWHDDSRGGPIKDDALMDEARRYLHITVEE